MFNFLINSAQTEEVIEVGDLVLTIDAWWWPYLFAFVKYFLIFLTVLLTVGIILVLIRIQGSFKVRIKEAVEEAMEAGRLPKTKTQKRWEVIISGVKSNNPKDYKKAVISAEELFDDVLKAAGFSGEDLESRLKKVPENQLDFKDDIVWSFNLKNKILSDENLEIDHEEAKRAVYIFERALKELNIL
jgi:hypothetical protein